MRTSFKEFCQHAGSKVNIEKTECILLGSLKDNFHNTYNIRVNTTCLKCLGIYLGHDKDECYKRNWENTMKDMEKLFESWKKRKLTIFGKCEIINTLAISKLIYIASILHLPPPNFIKDVNKLIYSFLWNSRDRIKRNTVIGPIKDGGIGLVDLETKLKALKASWVSKLFNDTGNINNFLTDILSKHSLSINYILKCNETNMSFLSTFYEQVFVSFNECKKLTPLHSLSTCSFFQQPIWMNRYFRFRGKTLYFSSWIKSNILYVKDLFTEHGFKTFEEIGGILRQKQNWLCEYNIVRNVFKRYENIFNYSMSPYVNIRDITSFTFVTKYDTFCGKRCNFYYHMLLRKTFTSPSYKSYLGRQFGISDRAHWEAIYVHKICETYDNDLSDFNYKLLNNLLCNNLYLSKWKQDITQFCDTCVTEVENSEHLIFTCNNVKNIWYTLGISLKIDIKWKHIVVGFFHEAKSRKYQGVFEVKSRVKTWQVRGIWSQQLEHKQVPKWGTEPGVRKGKRSLLASHTRCKCTIETTHNSVKVKLGIKVVRGLLHIAQHDPRIDHKTS